MKFFLETVSLLLLVIIVAVDAGTQHHFAKRNNIQIRDIHVPHPRLRRVYFLQHASNNLESQDNSKKDGVEVLPAKTNYDSTKQTLAAVHKKVTPGTTLEAATTSLPKEELTTSVSVKEPQLPDTIPSEEVKSPSSSDDVKKPELPSETEKIKSPSSSDDVKEPELLNEKVTPPSSTDAKSPSSSDVKEPELPEQNEEEKIHNKQHRRDVYYLKKQYENEDEIKNPLTSENSVPSKLETTSLNPVTELLDETTSLPTDLNKKKVGLKKPEKVNEEKAINNDAQNPAKPEEEKPVKEDENLANKANIKNPVQEVEPDLKNSEKINIKKTINDDVQKPVEPEVKTPAKEDEDKENEEVTKNPVQEVEVKEDELVERRKRDVYECNLKHGEEKSKINKEGRELNNPYIPLKADKEKSTSLDDELYNHKTSTSEPEKTVPLDTNKKDLNAKKPEEEAVSVDKKKKVEKIPSEIKVEDVTESKLEEINTLGPNLAEISTLESINKDITTNVPLPEETPKEEVLVEKRQKRNTYTLLEDKQKPTPLINKKAKVEETSLSPIDTTVENEESVLTDEVTLPPIIESLTSPKTIQEPKPENTPTITKTNYKMKNSEALVPVPEEEKESKDKQKIEKLPIAIETSKKEEIVVEPNLYNEESNEKTNDEKLPTSSDSEYEQKNSNQVTKPSQASGEKPLEKRKRRSSYKYFAIKKEQNQPQSPDDEPIEATASLEDKVDQVTAFPNEKVTELNKATTSLEVEVDEVTTSSNEKTNKLNELTTAKEELEHVTVASEESLTTVRLNEKEQEKKETSIVKSRLRRNEYYNKLQEQLIKKEEIKKEEDPLLKNEESMVIKPVSKPEETSTKPTELNKEQPLKNEESKVIKPVSKPEEADTKPTELVSTLESLLTTETATTTTEPNDLVELATEKPTSITNDEENKIEIDSSKVNPLPQEN